MYIARIRIQNFRCFKETEIEFQPGLNVIIGENNSGKTTVLRALMLVFDRRSRVRPTVHDFYRLLEPLDSPPTITAQVTIRSSPTDSPGDRALVSAWLTKLEPKWEAQLSYNFFLPDQHHFEFAAALRNLDRDHFFEVVEEFLPKYVSRVYAGNPATKVVADSESLGKFDCQFLDALRDVETEMFAGGTPLFRSMLEEVMDVGIEPAARRALRQDFRAKSGELRKSLLDRLKTEQLFRLARETGAADGGHPSLEGALDEEDLIAALRLFVMREQFSFPATHNGLGYNNLMYISLVLSSLSFRSSVDRRGQNAAIFPMLLVEEPEAHLHPALQYKLLSHIVSRVQEEPHKNRQVFVTTHSTHITAAAGLQPIICLSIAESGAIDVCYPAKLFDEEGKKSRGYVERYLDATKSSMLFAKATVLVEGIAEQLIVPAIARALERSFDSNHVAIVRVDGLTFQHFLPLFGAGVSPDKLPFALSRKVACLIDADPCRRKLNEPKARWRACYPFQLDLDPAQYAYRAESGALTGVKALVAGRANIAICDGKKTLEYELALVNLGKPCVITDAMDSAEGLRTLCEAADSLPDDLANVLDQEVIDDLAAVANMDDQKKHRFAALYLGCVSDQKGAHAFALEKTLRTLGSKELPRSEFVVPSYIQRAIEWVTIAPTPSRPAPARASE